MTSKAKLIIPPTEIRVIIEKAAGFVAKNGRQFEDKILENERNNPKFNFMFTIDPYHLYYRKRLEELIEGGPDAIAKAITDSKASEAQNSSKMETTATEQEVVEEEVPAVKLDELDFLIQFPTISALDMDIIKLTAQFAAKNGKQFILHLAQKESRNPQFDFLKPHHNLHDFYQSLVRQYSLVFTPTDAMMERVKRCAHSPHEQLDLMKHRARIEKLDRQRQQEEQDTQEAEREAFAKINWHDFSICDTVLFAPEDRERDLAAPLDMEAFKFLPITQRLELWTGRKLDIGPVPQVISPTVEDNDEEEEMEMEDEVEFTANVTPVILPAKRPNEVIMGAAFGGAPVKVRTDYVPRAMSAASSTSSTGCEPIQICSICKASIPVSQIDEHIRIELLDPKWRQQRMAMLNKNRDSNLVETGTDVSRNLEQLARHRSDIFESSGTSSASANIIERGPTRPIWDGHVDSIPQINRAAQIMAKPQIEREMAALQQAGDVSLDPQRGIGPRVPTGYAPRPPMMPGMPGMPFPPMPHGSQPGLPLPPMPPGWQPGMPLPPMPPGWQPGMPLPPMPPNFYPPPPPPKQ